MTMSPDSFSFIASQRRRQRKEWWLRVAAPVAGAVLVLLLAWILVGLVLGP